MATFSLRQFEVNSSWMLRSLEWKFSFSAKPFSHKHGLNQIQKGKLKKPNTHLWDVLDHVGKDTNDSR